MRRGYPLVMSFVVGDDEVGVEKAQIEEVAKEAVDPLLSVAYLMAHDNVIS